MSKSRGDSGNGNAEIIALLNVIGERLIRSEHERAAIRRAFGALEDKTAQSEKVFLTLQNKLARREQVEAALLQRQQKLETAQKNFSEKIERAELLSEKLEQTIARQDKLVRQLEGIVQERARMLRKLERIEESVLSTQNALEAKAMVLLTDRNVAEESNLPQVAAKKALEKKDTPVNDNPLNDNKGLWSAPARVRAAAVAGFIAVAGLSGWMISQMETSPLPQVLSPAGYSMADGQTVAEAISTDVTAVFPETLPETAGMAETTAAPAGDIADEALEKPAQPGVTQMDEDTLLAVMEDNPEALAQALNEIVPAAGPVPEKLDESAAKAAPEKTDKAPLEQASFSPRASAAEAVFDVKAFLDSQHDPRPPASRIAPDPALPDIVREIEKKAFDGIPEAQHDLAAIYTAGHGGVTIDYARAAQWFRESAYNGIANARYNLGVLYHQGLGVAQDTDLAIGWYRAAAALDHPEAQYNLGIAYIEGIGVSYNPGRAAYYFEQAARAGIIEAAYNLGLIHENGLLGQPAPQDALYWYKTAADRGSPEGRAAMEQLAKTMNLDSGQMQRIYESVREVEQAAAVQGAGAPQPENIARTGEAAVKPARQEIAPDKTTKTANSGRVAIPDDDERIPNEVIQAIPKLSMSDLEGPEGAMAATTPETSRQAVIAQIQEQLIRFGLYPGPADGSYNPVLEDAIRSYQQDFGLEVTGLADEALLAHMLSSGAASALVPAEFGSRAQ